MRSTGVFFLALIVFVILAGKGFAVPSAKTLEYAAASEGKVIFDGKTHSEKGLKCGDCHPKLFPMKRGTGFKMADLNDGKACGACHNGQKAFKTTENANCSKCHKK